MRSGERRAYCTAVYWKSLAYYPNKMKYEGAYDSFLINTSRDQYEEQKIITQLKDHVGRRANEYKLAMNNDGL